MDVRSLSPEKGGVLLPFRHRDDGGEPDGHGDGAEGTPPTVVHLTGRRQAAEVPAGPGRRPRWVRLAVASACVALVGGGAVAVALTGVFPLATERPQPRPAVSAPPTSGPESGNLPAAYGLCKAFDRAADRGDDVATAQAFRNLAYAAGGASQVSDYCAPFDELDRGRAR